MELGPRIIMNIGGLNIPETVFYAWIVSFVMIAFALISTRKMTRVPKGSQAVAELIVEMIYSLVSSTMGPKNVRFAPYIGTLFIFLILGNSLGLLEQRPVTADLNTTFALAGITFVLIHYNAIRAKTLKGYIKHLAAPLPFMLPINIVGELAFPLSISFRLFGNITGGVIIMALLFGGLEGITENLGITVPFLLIGIPLPANFFFDMFEAVLQAFIFTMLSMVFIANGMSGAEEGH
jgi:F-type H+-transporting ATPase subunit a